VERLVVTLKLRKGTQERAAKLIAAGPPFDPANLGLARHAVYLGDDLVIFAFEGKDVEQRVRTVINDPVASASFARWAALRRPSRARPRGLPLGGGRLDSTQPSRPRGRGASTSQGRPYTIFRRALDRENLLVAEATAKELPPLNLTDALELTVLIARKDPRRHPRVAARWLLRFLEKSTGWRKRLPEKLSPKGGPEYVGKLKAVSRRYVGLITAGDRSIDDKRTPILSRAGRARAEPASCRHETNAVFPSARRDFSVGVQLEIGRLGGTGPHRRMTSQETVHRLPALVRGIPHHDHAL
jgi:hypothetical protein